MLKQRLSLFFKNLEQLSRKNCLVKVSGTIPKQELVEHPEPKHRKLR